MNSFFLLTSGCMEVLISCSAGDQEDPNFLQHFLRGEKELLKEKLNNRVFWVFN